jgi:hypothetical protein
VTNEIEAMAALVGVSPAVLFEFYAERAAIREFDGGYSRADAERLAIADTEKLISWMAP